jgi:hypothetical protein
MAILCCAAKNSLHGTNGFFFCLFVSTEDVICTDRAQQGFWLENSE